MPTDDDDVLGHDVREKNYRLQSGGRRKEMCSGSLRPFHGSYTSILLLSRLAQRPLVGVRHSNAAAIRISVSEMEREVLQQKK